MSTLTRNPEQGLPISLLDLEMVGILVLTLTCLISGVDHVQAAEPSQGSADHEMTLGKRLLTQGSYSQSAVHLTEAERLYKADENIRQQSRALTYLAYALQQDGQIRQAHQHLEDALKLSDQLGDDAQKATIFGQMGNGAMVLNKSDAAVAYLKEALRLAKNAKNPALEASLLNDLGNALTVDRQLTEAIQVFPTSSALAEQTGQPALALTALVNLATAHNKNFSSQEAHHTLDKASSKAQSLRDSYAKAYGYLNIGLGYRDLLPAAEVSASKRISAPTAKSESSLIQKARTSFQQAVKVAEHLGDARAVAYAKGYIGSLLEREHNYTEALKWTREAVFAAQKGTASDSLYQWQWQTARLLKAMGNVDNAMSAYERAVEVFQPIRRESLEGYQHRHHSFKDSVAPLFVEFHDVHLRRAAQSQDDKEVQALLIKVRNAAESSRIAELQDYYRDECVDNARLTDAGNKDIPEETAVIYPIILPDRLELLLQTADNKLQRFEVPIKAEQLTEQVNEFRAAIEKPTSFYEKEIDAATLYDSLLKPLRTELTNHSIHTLVFVPDGPLRTIPIGALYDKASKQYAIDQYAITVTPSMELTDTRSVNLAKANVLSMGLTVAQGTEFPALKKVELEVRTLTTLYDGRLLLDGEYLVPTVEQELNKQEVSIVHFATHGKLEDDVSKSFLLTYEKDERISMDRLSGLVGLLRHRLVPLELLTLSACETAAGDDRAALGLAGVAVKAGARSALATLWQVDDEATSELVLEFYRQVKTEATSKADALQQAQLKIKRTQGHEHPNFWAPFLLIGNWR
ncbi:MAG: CHAT domain-containing protein [Nitrospira sp.]|nr:CHAT domain-containing protein [Nitrospira sp.]